MKVSYTWLQTYFEKQLPPPGELGELINSHVFEVESIEKVGTDTCLDIKVMPDKAHYALCHKGIAREIRAVSGIMLKEQKIKAVPKDQTSLIEVKIEAKELCNRYMARRIDNVTIGQSSDLIKERFATVGARVINSIVDATNYIMFDIGQPLHAFDADLVKGAIVVRNANKGEKVELLPETQTIDGKIVMKERVVELTPNDLVIADDVGVLAIAGIKGGKRAEISSKTKNIIIESANFHPVSVRRTANRLNLRNESSRRFENEIIPELSGDAMSAVSALILESSPDALFRQITDEFVKPTPKRTVTVSAPFVMSKLGMAVNEREVKEAIDATGSEIAGRDGEIIVIPPLDRLDLRIPEDFVDEVARIKGYDRMTSVLPPVLDRIQLPVKSFYVSEKIKNILCGAGYSEVLLYSLVEKGSYNIEYPLASDKSALRESIVPKMLESLKLNAVSLDLLGSDTIKIFEIGKVFPESGEKTVLTLGVNLLRKKKGITAESMLVETIAMLEQNLGLKLITNIVKDGTSAVAECDFDGVVGGLSTSGSLQSLDFAILPRDIKYKPFSLYPFITRDVAVFVPKAITPEAVWQAIEKTLLEKNAMDLVVRHSLFDVFEKDGKTSFAYRIVFQSMDRTLKDEEIGGIMTMIYEQMKQKGWEVR